MYMYLFCLVICVLMSVYTAVINEETKALTISR